MVSKLTSLPVIRILSLNQDVSHILNTQEYELYFIRKHLFNEKKTLQIHQLYIKSMFINEYLLPFIFP